MRDEFDTALLDAMRVARTLDKRPLTADRVALVQALEVMADEYSTLESELQRLAIKLDKIKRKRKAKK